MGAIYLPKMTSSIDTYLRWRHQCVLSFIRWFHHTYLILVSDYSLPLAVLPLSFAVSTKLQLSAATSLWLYTKRHRSRVEKNSLTKFSHWEPEEKLEPSHCSTVCIMERPRNCFVSCFLNIFSWIPVLDALLDRTDLAVQIPRSNLVSHKRSFVPSAARIWNSLPEYIPSLEKRACFKKEVNRYLGDN